MAYCLRLPHGMKQLHPVFNVVKLTPALDDLITERMTEDHPPPIVIDGEAEWEVKEILDSHWHWRRFQYCKRIALSLPLNCKATLQSSLSLFKYY